LAAMDPFDLLSGREHCLSRLFALLDQRGVFGREFLLLECGARQNGASMQGSMANGGIALFMGANAAKLNCRYIGFEPEYSSHGVLEELARKGMSEDLAQALLRSVANAATADFGELQRQARTAATEGKPVVIFSNHVLNDPELKREFPFWTFPGLHLHSAAYEELCKFWLADHFLPQVEELKASTRAAFEAQGRVFYCDLDDEDWLWERVCADARIKNPFEHVEWLRKAWGVPAAPILSDYTAGRDVMLYVWEA
ncbi:MAG: hypothetical protein K1X83_08660, partial [Oligoflexia bacterium]|nr:hypothetical protein [Oligoflexia bacterium]